MASAPSWVTSTFTSNTAFDYANDRITLDEDDPFESVLINIVKTFRKKNADYADGSSWSSNFEDVASQMGFEHPVLAADALIAVKQARLRSLAAKGVQPENESVLDTYLDRAVYGVIALALLQDDRFTGVKEEGDCDAGTCGCG